MLKNDEVDKALSKFVKYVTSQARANLTRKDKNVSRKLYDSIKGKSKVNPNSIEVSFEMEEYGTFQDLGVKGKTSSNRAPDSPYRFGTGTGKKGGLTEGTKDWVRARRIQFKNKDTGRFLSYDQTAFLVARSVYNKGITASRFFSKPFDAAFDKLPDEIIEAYGLDIDNFLRQTMKQ